MEMFLKKTGWIIGLVLLTGVQTMALSKKERAKGLMEEINAAAGARDASFAESESKAKKEIHDREEKIKKMKYEPQEISIELQVTPSDDESPVAIEKAPQREANEKENRPFPEPTAQSSTLPTISENESISSTQESLKDQVPEANPAELLGEIVDKKAVESELQEYEGLATQEEVAVSEEDNQTPAEVEKSAGEEKLAAEVKEPASERKNLDTKMKAGRKKVAQKSKKNSKISKKTSKFSLKLAKLSKKKNQKKSKLLGQKKSSGSKIAKQLSSKNISRGPASMTEK